MTRKDYELIALAINKVMTAPFTPHPEVVVWAVAGALALDNVRFDYERFLTACGVAGEVPQHRFGVGS